MPTITSDNAEPTVGMHSFCTPVVSGTGKHLPALLGLRSLTAKSAILEMTPGKECLTFPGPNGYRIKCEPGALRIPLVRAPSGHLVIPTDKFQELKANQAAGGLPAQAVSLHMSSGLGSEREAVPAKAGSTQPSSSSSSTPPIATANAENRNPQSSL